MQSVSVGLRDQTPERYVERIDHLPVRGSLYSDGGGGVTSEIAPEAIFRYREPSMRNFSTRDWICDEDSRKRSRVLRSTVERQTAQAKKSVINADCESEFEKSAYH